MFHVIKKDTYDEVSVEAAKIVSEVLRKDNPVLGLATGSSPEGMYKELIKDYNENNVSWENVITFNLDEYIGLPKEHEQSYWTFMQENIFKHVNIKPENIHMPDGEAADPQAACDVYEAELQKFTVDLQVLGIGSDGHIAFNEPGVPFDSTTHVMDLTEQTRKDNSRFFDNNIDLVPKQAASMGLASIMRSKKIVLIATGANKADAVNDMLNGPKTTDCPASILQDHPDVTVILDKEAASKLA